MRKKFYSNFIHTLNQKFLGNHSHINKIKLTGPTISETCETVVPDAAPRYKTFEPGGM